MKLAFTGKGGVGKTTMAALLCRLFELEGAAVLAVDADPDANLAQTLGFSAAESPGPVSGLKELIEARTGAKPGSSGIVFKMNPKVDDIPERYCARRGTLRLINMGTVDGAGAGCMCPENAFLKALMSHMMFRETDNVVMDMEAGIEHLGRGTASMVDAMIVVVQPDGKAVDTARRIVNLWTGLGDGKKVCFAANAVRDEKDEKFLRENLAGHPLLAMLPYSEAARVASRDNVPPFERDPAMLDRIKEFRDRLDAFICGKTQRMGT